MNAFSLTPATAQEWWRLWSAHLVHWDAWHLTLNLIAFAAPAPLLESRMRKMLVLALFAAAPIVSVVILTVPGFGEYRGASGLAVGFWTAAAVILLARGDRFAGLLLAGLVAAKLSLEVSSVTLWTSNFEVLREAHLAGAVTGAVIAFGLVAVSYVTGLEKGGKGREWRPQRDSNPCRRRERAVS